MEVLDPFGFELSTRRQGWKLGKTLEDIGTGGKFLNRTPIAYALR